MSWSRTGRETNRGNAFEFLTEQSLREVYAKAFQIAMQEGDSKASMTGYGHIAGFSNTSNYNIGTRLYQEQWGLHTYFVTDGYIGWVDRTSLDMMVRTGIQMELYTTPYVEYLSGEWNAEKNTVMVGSNNDIESPTQWYAVRMSAKGILYQIADLAPQFNGYSELAIEGKELATGTKGVSYNQSVAIPADMLTDGSSATYELKGNLPDGVSLNESTGAVSGTPGETGTYRFTVNYLIDGYVSLSADYTMTINPAFMLDTENDFAALEIGEEVAALITSSVYKASNYDADSMTYTVASGAFPAGLTLSADGIIEGKPTEAGTFVVTIKLYATKTTTNTKKGTTSVAETTAYFDLTIKVNGEAVAPEWTENVPYIKNGNWYMNGKDLGVKAQGANGTNGTNGVGFKSMSSKDVDGGKEYTVTLTNDETFTFTIKDGASVAASSAGCGGVIGIGGGVLAVMAVLGAVMVVRKKED